MADIATMWNEQTGLADWGPVTAGTGDLASGGDLATAVLISLFTDATAGDDDAIADRSDNPRGWWAGAIGSKLWLRLRAKQTDGLLPLVRDDIAAAVAWMIDDGVAGSIDIDVEWTKPGMLGCQITVHRAGAPDQVLQFEWAWRDI